ncbi:fucose permease [Pseudomonas baetica]|uniref:Fucose permease n=1 Tax=Pseudomonas baetica TaxID=674054 RepID=A0ABX4Q7P0_9PSED|nr:MFS transporter [Pseudomonas baetica]PKA72809.1 fucose permease [Pseudomonas baetica]PTC16777.1 MFS transporter [Pseudomonas baetica]
MIQANKLFFASCLSLLVTSMIFSIRADVLQSISADYLLSNAMIGLTISSVFWGFTLGIISCALIVDWVGMKCLHIVSGLGYLLGITLILLAPANSSGQPIDDVFAATGTTVLYLGFLLTGIAQGIVEGVTNPLVATLFKRDKRRMLTRLHAWWPMGLIVGGLIAWGLGQLGLSWQVKLAVVALPTLGYLMLVIALQYPSTERVDARISSGVMFAQLKRPLFIVLMLLMWLTAATELAPDQWFAKIMVDLLPQLGSNSILLLVYTAGLMFILRHYASGWIFARYSPFAVLTSSAVLTLVGLLGLGLSGQSALQGGLTGAVALFCVTAFGVGKTFFWPTMLAITSELLPKGGALLINLMGGAGMLSVMVAVPAIGSLMDQYDTASALLVVALLPSVLVIAFASLWLYSRKRGGYRPNVLEAPH